MATGKPSAVWFADDEDGSRIGYSYFPDGSLKEMTYPGGKKQSWTYDNQGRTVTFTDTASVTTTYTHTDLGQIHTAKTSTGDSVDYGYDTLGRLDRTTRGNGVITSVEWDDRNQPTVITHTRNDGGLVSKNTHEYDIRGNLTKTVTETPANREEARHRGDRLRLRHRRPAHLIQDHPLRRHGHRNRLQAERGLRRHRRDPHHGQAGRDEGEAPPSRGSTTRTDVSSSRPPAPRTGRPARPSRSSTPTATCSRTPTATPSPTPPPDTSPPPPARTEPPPATPTGPPDSAKPPPTARDTKAVAATGTRRPVPPGRVR